MARQERQCCPLFSGSEVTYKHKNKYKYFYQIEPAAQNPMHLKQLQNVTSISYNKTN